MFLGVLQGGKAFISCKLAGCLKPTGVRRVAVGSGARQRTRHARRCQCRAGRVPRRVRLGLGPACRPGLLAPGSLSASLPAPRSSCRCPGTPEPPGRLASSCPQPHFSRGRPLPGSRCLPAGLEARIRTPGRSLGGTSLAGRATFFSSSWGRLVLSGEVGASSWRGRFYNLHQHGSPGARADSLIDWKDGLSEATREGRAARCGIRVG